MFERNYNLRAVSSIGVLHTLQGSGVTNTAHHNLKISLKNLKKFYYY